MNLKKVLEFLADLKENNNRKWFNDNKETYKQSLGAFEEFVTGLIDRTIRYDPEIATASAKDSIFRIYRDTRFSQDKTPYKTHFGAYIAPGGRKKEGIGYYVHLEPGGSFAAGGLYRPPNKTLTPIRKAVSGKFGEFLEIVEDETFVEAFGSITDVEKLKTAPRGFSPDDEAIEYLRLKSFIAVAEIDDRQILGGDPEEAIASVFGKLADFVGFLREGKNLA